MLLCIMTRGRVGKQETLKWIPTPWKDKVRLICPLSEVMPHSLRHRDIQIVAQPDHVTNYSQKFQWLTYEAFPEENKIVIMDDDLYFNQYEDDKLCTIKNPEQVHPLFVRMEAALDSVALVGVHPRMMAQNVKGKEHDWVGKIVTIQGLNRSLIPPGLTLDHHPILADVRLNCELLSRGIATVRICTHFVDWLPSQAAGGCDYRTAEMQREATASIARDFGPFAKQVIKRPKSSKWLGDERYDLQVRWKDLYYEGLRNAGK